MGKELSKNEVIIAKRLLRKPLKVLELKDEKFMLTEIGTDVAEGFIEGLLHLKEIKNAV